MRCESSPPFRNGEILSQEQFTELILSQEAISALTLITMAYNFPPEDGNAMRIHRHLLHLADAGTAVKIGVDNTYANRVEAKSDLPIFIAKLFGNKALLEKKEHGYQELAVHPNVRLRFHGQEHADFFPFRNIEHRKLLLVNQSIEPDFAAIFGFNINYQLDRGIIDSGIFINTLDALAWLQAQAETKHFTLPTKERIDDLTFITRELTDNGNEFANNEIREMIQSAKNEVLFCGQWLPDGETFGALHKAALKGVKVDVYSNFPPITRQPIYSLFRFKFAKDLARIARETGNIQFYVPNTSVIFFHIKALITDVHDPQNATALTGNDNMTNVTLQKLGLRDIMVRLNNYDHVTNLYRYLEENVFPNATPFDFNSLNLRRIVLSSLSRAKNISKE